MVNSVEVSRRGVVTVVTLARPRVRNAVDFETAQQLYEAWRDQDLPQAPHQAWRHGFLRVICRKTTEEMAMRGFMRWFVLLGVVLSGLAACGSMPQSHREFVNYPRGIEKITFTVPRGLDAIIQGVNRQADACVHVGARRSGTMSSMNISLRTLTIKKVSATSAELDFQERSNNMVGEPKGGFYLVTADMVAKGRQSTAITLSHTGYNQDIVAATRKWIEGDLSSCHGYQP